MKLNGSKEHYKYIISSLTKIPINNILLNKILPFQKIPVGGLIQQILISLNSVKILRMK